LSSRVVLRPLAENDLIEIYAFIAQLNPDAAIRIVRKIRAQCEMLAAKPERGSPRERLGDAIRVLVIERRITVAYRVQTDRVDILRIFYAGQNIPERLTDQ
jgi:plasmid stabilization system protein ParE